MQDGQSDKGIETMILVQTTTGKLMQKGFLMFAATYTTFISPDSRLAAENIKKLCIEIQEGKKNGMQD